jgi:hypothetical protein
MAGLSGMDEPSLKDEDVRCLGYLRKVVPLLDRLHEVGCQRDTAGNRELHFDEYCKLVLLYLWNPLIDSMRALQEATGLASVAKALGVKRFSVGSFSESSAVFDPARLKEVVQELAGELGPPRVLGNDPALADLQHVLTLVDSTVLSGLSKLAHAAADSQTRYTTARDGRAVHGYRLHTQFDLATFLPHRIQRTGARHAGDQRENQILRRSLEPGRCYVGDGGYADHSLFEDITQADSSYVIRIRGNSALTDVEEHLLSQEALDAGVVRDAEVNWGGTRLRLIELRVAPHARRTRSGVTQSDRLVLATNLWDLPAELVGLIYQKRYSVELFFRFFKHLLGMRHLLSQRPAGIDIQVYCTVIICLLINRMTGQKPNKSMRNMIGWYLLGLATQQELIDHLNKPDHTGVKQRAKDALWKKLGY